MLKLRPIIPESLASPAADLLISVPICCAGSVASLAKSIALLLAGRSRSGAVAVGSHNTVHVLCDVGSLASVQDAFTHLYGALRSGKCIHYPKAWVLCVIRRAASRRLQERLDHEQLEDYEHIPTPDHEPSAFSLVADYLSVPSRREEEVLLLRLEAMKYREIADQLGISMSSVNTILARALQKLKKVASQHSAKEGEVLHEKKTFHRAS